VSEAEVTAMRCWPVVCLLAVACSNPAPRTDKPKERADAAVAAPTEDGMSAQVEVK